MKGSPDQDMDLHPALYPHRSKWTKVVHSLAVEQVGPISENERHDFYDLGGNIRASWHEIDRLETAPGEEWKR